MSWLYRIRKATGIDSAVRELQSMQQRAEADKGVDDVDEIRQGRSVYSSEVLASTGGPFSGDQISDTSSEALAGSNENLKRAIGAFKIAEGKNVVDLWLRFYKDLKDYSGNGLDASLAFGTTQYASGRARDAFLFDGLTGLEVADNAKTRVASQFSYEFWLEPLVSLAQEGGTNQRILNKWDDASNEYAIGFSSGGTLNFRVERAGVVTDASVANGVILGTRKHYVLVHNAGTITIYINGASQALGSSGLGANSASTTLKIGHHTATAGRLSAALSPVRRYNYALNASEALNLYNTGFWGGSIYDPPMCVSFGSVSA